MGNSSFMELSALTSNAAKQSNNFYNKKQDTACVRHRKSAKQSNNFYNSLTSQRIVNPELELFYYPFRILHRHTM